MNRQQRRAAEKQSRQTSKKSSFAPGEVALINRAADIQARLHQALQDHKDGNLLGAERGYRAVLELKPDLASAQNALGSALQSQGRTDEALEAYDAAIELDPNFAEAKTNKANLQSALGQSSGSVSSFAINQEEVEATTLFNRANHLKAQGSLKEAGELFAQVIKLSPRHARAYANLGDTFVSMGSYDAAEAMIKASLLFEPDNPETLNGLGLALLSQGKLSEATTALKSSIDQSPHSISTLINLGNVYKDCGRVEEAIDLYQRAQDIAPRAEIHSNIIFAKHYLPGCDAQTLFDELREWDQLYASPITPLQAAFENNSDPQKRLRVGLISGSFHRHPVGYMTISALEAINHELIELVLYSNGVHQDDMTERFRTSADDWVSTAAMTDQDVAERVRADQIDILIDLAGHSDGFRLLVFARRPAPIQMKWVGGQFNTTGMASIDYLITDNVETPPGEDHLYTEELIRLPDGYVSYDPPFYAPSVGPLPAAQNGAITFGCFNNLTKVSGDVVDLWAEILAAVPDSRLVLKSKALNDDAVRQHYGDMFAVLGIESERIELRAASAHERLLAEYNDIDIALDPFPYSGGLTTVEALWMGVPVISMPGSTFAGRHAATHLTNVGLDDWLAYSPEHYMALAIKWGQQLDELAQLRSGLRERVANSPLCDSPAFARNFETALRGVWQQWCDETNSPKLKEAKIGS